MTICFVRRSITCVNRQRAILLIGPTGSGKTPLGEWLEAHGLPGSRCHHFDFGARLRAVAADPPEDFTPPDVFVVRNVVEKGALLEDATFHLALRILQDFLDVRQPHARDLLILNGLPRHLGQADAISDYVELIAVLHLECDARTVRERLGRNSGGDRAGRTDDSLSLVKQKLAIFAERTRPLLDYYRDRGVPLIAVKIGADTNPAQIYPELKTVWVRLSPGRRQDANTLKREVRGRR